MDDRRDGRVAPALAVLALSAFEAPTRRGNTVVVQALAFRIQRGALRDVGDDFPDDARFLFHDL